MPDGWSGTGGDFGLSSPDFPLNVTKRYSAGNVYGENIMTLSGLDQSKSYDLLTLHPRSTGGGTLNIYHEGLTTNTRLVNSEDNTPASSTYNVLESLKMVPDSSGEIVIRIDQVGDAFYRIAGLLLTEFSGNVTPPTTNQALFNEIAAVTDFGMAPFQTSAGDGGSFEDAAYLIEATNGSEVQGFKGFGNDMPSVSNFPAFRRYDPSTADLWYADEGGYPHFVNDTGEGLGFLRIRNGAGLEFMTDPGNISPAITAPYSEFMCIRVKPGAFYERTGNWYMQGNTGKIRFLQTNPDITTTTDMPILTWSKLFFTIDGSGNWSIELNGTVIDSGTGGTLTSITEWLIGANGHPIEHDFAFVICKYGAWSAGDKTMIEDNAEILYPNALPLYPHFDNIHILDWAQFDAAANVWDVYRGKTVTFGGGTGTEGATTYQWYYWDGAASGSGFPEDSVLDSHFAFPGADGQNSTLDRDHYISGNGRGNATLFNNPGGSPNMKVMCVITPIDSNGVEGDKIVTAWALDNI